MLDELPADGHVRASLTYSLKPTVYSLMLLP